MKHFINLSKSDDGSEYQVTYFDDADNTIHTVSATISKDTIKSNRTSV